MCPCNGIPSPIMPSWPDARLQARRCLPPAVSDKSESFVGFFLQTPAEELRPWRAGTDPMNGTDRWVHRASVRVTQEYR